MNEGNLNNYLTLSLAALRNFLGLQKEFPTDGQVSEVNKSPTDSVGRPNRSKTRPIESVGLRRTFFGPHRTSDGVRRTFIYLRHLPTDDINESILIYLSNLEI